MSGTDWALVEGVEALAAAVAVARAPTVNEWLESEEPPKSGVPLYAASSVYVPAGVPAGSK